MKPNIAAFVGTALAALTFATAGHAQILVDGTLDAAYGPATASVLYDPAAPESNFGAPGPTTSGESYNIYLSSGPSDVYGYVQGTGAGASAGSFTNLYFDLDPQNANGSDIGFEVTNNDIFVAGGGNMKVAAGITFVINGDNIEFSIPNADFTSALPGLNYASGQQFASVGSNVTLRLSQSLGYSVAGGATYGPNRLGSVQVGGAPGAVSAAPEPGAWALMLAGVGLLGGFLRVQQARRREDGVTGVAAA